LEPRFPGAHGAVAGPSKAPHVLEKRYWRPQADLAVGARCRYISAIFPEMSAYTVKPMPHA
jgi:hypothetical protein